MRDKRAHICDVGKCVFGLPRHLGEGWPEARIFPHTQAFLNPTLWGAAHCPPHRYPNQRAQAMPQACLACVLVYKAFFSSQSAPAMVTGHCADEGIPGKKWRPRRHLNGQPTPDSMSGHGRPKPACLPVTGWRIAASPRFLRRRQASKAGSGIIPCPNRLSWSWVVQRLAKGAASTAHALLSSAHMKHHVH